jgi:hypothetical protein
MTKEDSNQFFQIISERYEKGDSYRLKEHKEAGQIGLDLFKNNEKKIDDLTEN